MTRRGAADLERLLAARGAGDAAAALAAALGAPSAAPARHARLLSPLARALARRPRDAELRAARGRLLLRLGRAEEAAAELERAARLAPGRTEPRLWLGAARLLRGELDAAARELDARLAAVPDDAAALALRAAAAAGAGDDAAARAGAEKAAASAATPGVRAGARALLGLLETREGRAQAALSAFDAALELDPGAPWLLGLRACARRRAGDPRGARADLDAALRREPSSWLLAERSSLREEAGDAAGALRDLDAALRRDGRSAELRQRRANLLAQAGRLADAAAEARRALASPDGGKALGFCALLARALAAGGEPALALSLARLVARAAPRERVALSAWADALDASGRAREAAAVRARAGIAVAPARPETPGKAFTLAAAGRLAEAESAARAELAARPGAASLLVLVEVLLRRGRAGEAAAALERERPRLPPPAGAEDLSARYRLAVLAGDPAAAEAAGEALLALSREFRHVDVLCRPYFVGEFDFMSLPAAFLDGLHAALDRRVAAAPRSPWPRFLRLSLCALTGASGARDTRAADCAALARVGARHAWMRGLVGQWRLITAGDLAGAEKDFRAAARACKPGDWTAWCFLGETLLCRGKEKEAFAAFASARRAAPASSAADARAWEGEMRLWQGRPAAALPLLEGAIKQGALYAEGWKGGALVLLGRYEQALPCLDRAIARTPHDAESRAWKAEALLRLGRPAEALATADEALGRWWRYGGFHLHALRGLARAALGEGRGPLDAAREIPAPVRDWLRQKEPAARGESPQAYAALCEALLRLSRGVRRGAHETAVWMR